MRVAEHTNSVAQHQAPAEATASSIGSELKCCVTLRSTQPRYRLSLNGFPDVRIGVDHMPTAELETTVAGHFQTHPDADIYRCPPGLGVSSPPGCSVNSEKTQFDTQAPSLASLRRNLTLDRGFGAQRAALTRHYALSAPSPPHPGQPPSSPTCTIAYEWAHRMARA
jgi:hypothetical protein